MELLLTFAHCKGRVLFSQYPSVTPLILFFFHYCSNISMCSLLVNKSNSLYYVLQSLIALKPNKNWKLKIIVEKTCISVECLYCGCTNFFLPVCILGFCTGPPAYSLFYLNFLSPSSGPKHNSFQESWSTVLLQPEIQYLSYILGIGVVLCCQQGCSCYYHV